ncbi:4-hydroxy-3-methylbut-2-enyl diphosphate reductase [Pseudomonas knackmussii B13]|uniref:4-hydroxy-3-methylbut-2-enyl diphosphate reductase n=1 Tax=Pseudomonas knackmussii (strain DSM 6978 / CCUG 54928 / LMG 23759 / B13) TaxID=1301098 RepID=A0A024HNN9_PSEKB|nr:4-hydroxy-3-methylbut-2-enyl diphosphate reductase [Pseudomonas knackmussii B13]
MQIKLANPRGFCAGVDRAIEIVNRALDVFGPPIYVRHEVVHNKFVVENLRNRGAVFVEELDQVPDDTIVIFSAHGVSQAVRKEAENRGLKVFDATCPLVTKVHMEVVRYSRDGDECILIGHEGHPEVEGTMGQYDNANGGDIYLVEDEEDVAALEVRNPEALHFVTQTTLSMDDTSKVIDALRAKFPHIKGPRKNDICYATQNRQDAVKDLADQCDLVLVVGSPNSSNSNRLRELAERMGTPGYLIDGAEDLKREWFEGKNRIGITAGASAPEVLVRGVIEQLREWGAEPEVELDGREENITFSMPKELRVKKKQKKNPASGGFFIGAKGQIPRQLLQALAIAVPASPDLTPFELKYSSPLPAITPPATGEAFRS